MNVFALLFPLMDLSDMLARYGVKHVLRDDAHVSMIGITDPAVVENQPTIVTAKRVEHRWVFVLTTMTADADGMPLTRIAQFDTKVGVIKAIKEQIDEARINEAFYQIVTD